MGKREAPVTEARRDAGHVPVKITQILIYGGRLCHPYLQKLKGG
jgi:hypothetical protein